MITVIEDAIPIRSTVVVDVESGHTTVIQNLTSFITEIDNNAVINYQPGSYVHEQPTASMTWIVNHNLGFKPAIKAITMGGVEVLSEVIHTSTNQAIIYFDSPLAGQAICS